MEEGNVTIFSLVFPCSGRDSTGRHYNLSEIRWESSLCPILSIASGVCMCRGGGGVEEAGC